MIRLQLDELLYESGKYHLKPIIILMFNHFNFVIFDYFHVKPIILGHF